MRPLDPGWYVAQVRPQCEAMVASLLNFKGYESFLPLRADLRRRTAPETPLFSGYVFFTAGDAVAGPVVTTPGVVRILGAGGCPQMVPETEIESLKRIARSGLPVSSWPAFETGAPVELIDGPLRGCRGVVRHLVGEVRLVVSVEVLQRSVAVQVQRSWVRGMGRMFPALAQVDRGA
jgi:transcription antitermination factor NusG